MTTRDPEGERRTILILSTVLFVVSGGISVAGLMLIDMPRDFLRPPVAGSLIAGLLVTIPMLAGLQIVRLSHWKWLHDLWRTPCELIGPAIGGATFTQLLLIAVMAGVGEELLFRGFLQHWLVEHAAWAGLIVPNIVFGLLHWVSRVYAAATFLVGLYLSCLLHFVPGVDLWSLMLAHGLYDLVALLVLKRQVDGTVHSDSAVRRGSPTPPAD